MNHLQASKRRMYKHETSRGILKRNVSKTVSINLYGAPHGSCQCLFLRSKEAEIEIGVKERNGISDMAV